MFKKPDILRFLGLAREVLRPSRRRRGGPSWTKRKDADRVDVSISKLLIITAFNPA